MKVPPSIHPIWETADRLILLAFLAGVLAMFATNFDDTEVKVLVAFGFAMTMSSATKGKVRELLVRSKGGEE